MRTNQARARIGLLGCGVVGSAFVRALRRQPGLLGRVEVHTIAVRDIEKPRAVALAPGLLSTSAMDVVDDPSVDIVVELMGGLDPAKPAIQRAIEMRKPVVTANKALLAELGPELRDQAASLGTPLLFEAAVGGGIPVVSTILEHLMGDEVLCINGVLNGTTNYILSAMQSGPVSFEEALEQAQGLGYAEADASRDLNGRDAADKLAILAQVAFRRATRGQDVDTRGIRADLGAVDDGRVWRLVARANPRKGELLVRPELLDPVHPFASLTNVDNGVELISAHSGRLFLSGPGAGGDATASAVLADFFRALRILAEREHGHARNRRD